jgi:hypothetical protein
MLRELGEGLEVGFPLYSYRGLDKSVRLISQIASTCKIGLNLVNMTSHLIEQSRD